MGHGIEQATLGEGRTYIVDRVVRRHAVRHAGEHVDLEHGGEQGAAEVGEVGDECARVEVAFEEIVSRVFKARLGHQLEAQPLVDVAELICLESIAPSGVHARAERPHTHLVLVHRQLSLQLLPLLISQFYDIVESMAL